MKRRPLKRYRSSGRRPPTRHLLLAALWGLACARSGPTATPGEAATQGAAADGRSRAPRVPVSDPDVLALPAWMHGLFDTGSRRSYSWTFEVDTHDEEGSVFELSGTLLCETEALTRYSLADGTVALASCHVCALGPEQEVDEIEPGLDGCYFASVDGLWLVASPPTEQEARTLVGTPPYLAASPKPESHMETLEDDGFVFDSSREIEQRESTGAWCRTDADTHMYGSSTTFCFAPELGLASLAIEGRSGPSIEDYSLIEISPASPR